MTYHPLTLALLIGVLTEAARVDIEASETDPNGPALSRAAMRLAHAEATLVLLRATGADVPAAIVTILGGLAADLIAHGAVLPYVLSDNDRAELVGLLTLANTPPEP